MKQMSNIQVAESSKIHFSYKWIMMFVLMILPLTVFGQWQESFSYKGDWSSWSSGIGSIAHYTDDSGLILKNSGGQTYFRFQINNYTPPSKESIKQHLKSGEWFEYTGTVEYYVNDAYPTAEAIAKSNHFVIPNTRRDETPNVMRKTNCRIRIQPYKKLPSKYNIFFDNIGVAISIKGLSFEGEKKHTNKGRVVANIAQSILLFPIGLGSWLWNPVREYDNR